MATSSFPEFITARRRELEMTLGDVASSLGVSPITVSNWSNGDSTPKPENLVALAELLEVPADELAEMADVSLSSTADSVNLLPPGAAATDDDVAEPLTEETEVSEPIAEVRLAEPETADDPAEVEQVDEPKTEVGIPEDFDKEAAEPVPSVDEVVEPEPEKPQPVEEDDQAPDSVPAFVATEAPAAEEAPASEKAPATEAPAAEKAPASRRRPGIRRPGGRTAEAPGERQVTTLPLTYIEDPKQLMRYRIRWALTVVILAIMFIILLWASRELLSALSEVKQAVTPGGIGNG